MSESAVGTVLARVGSLAVDETTFLCGFALEVECLKDELVRLQAYLKDTDNKWRSGNATLAILVSQIRDAAFEAQNVIEAADYVEKRNSLMKGFAGVISRCRHIPSDLVNAHKVGFAMQRVRRKLSEIFASVNNLGIDLDTSAILNGQAMDELPQNYSFMEQKADDYMVGFQNDYMEIKEKLFRGGAMLSAVSLVAMGGAGKTTLAREMYNSSAARQHFETVAWVTVSQTFKSVDLLKEVMCQVTGRGVGLVDQMEEYELRKKISEFLSEKKYLLVLDDVWEDDTWEQINRPVEAFPDNSNGSRILLTTRKETVATHADMHTYVHVLKGLDEQASWELFNSKALPSYRRYELADVAEFEKIGRMLAKRCEGLPLALAVLGGYLSKNLSIQTWSEVLACWPSTKKTQMMQAILARSYYDMADHYERSCFLYLAVFPEDREIDVSVLITLWLAEGLIPGSRNHQPEQTARNYVSDLAQRSLVQVTARSTAHGWIEEIKVHDVLRDWCIEEGRKDGFLDVIVKEASGQGRALSTDIMTSYHSCYQGFRAQKLKTATNLQSLTVFQKLVRQQPLFLPKLRFLRVLHIEGATLENFSSVIESCIHLRCLILMYCSALVIPASIGRLLYLQTVNLTGTDTPVPDCMWDIPSLRHVYVNYRVSPARSMHQAELQTFVLNEVIAFDRRAKVQSYIDNMVTFLGRMTELTTLRLDSTVRMPSAVMTIIASMPHLVDLCLTIDEIDALPEIHHLPQGLRRFQLYADAIKQDPMAVLEKLPCLVTLVLEGYTGLNMSCSARGFPYLQILCLFSFTHTEEWKIEVGAMPKLSKLRLLGFQKLSMLPEGLLHLSSLKLVDMSAPLVSFADDITVKELEQKGCEVKVT